MMALLDPTPPQTQDPNWTNQTHSVDQPKAIPVIDRSYTGKAIANLGTGLDSAVTLVDSAIKEGLKNSVYEQVDPIRDQFTGALERIKSDLNTGVIPPAVQSMGGPTAGKSLLDANAMADGPDLPAGLDTGLDRLTQLAQAKAAGSPKLNDTQYAKDTLSVAKQLRAQFPGYRDYIDQEVSKASGLPVANSYYQNMLQDINRQLVQLGSKKDDVKTMMEKNSDVPGMAQFYQRYNQGDKDITPGFVFSKIADWNNLQTQQKIDAANRAKGDADLTDKMRNTESGLVKDLNRTYDYFAGDKVSLYGMSGLGETMRYVQQVQAGMPVSDPDGTGRHIATDAEVKERVYNLQAYRQGVYEMMKKNSRDAAGTIGNDKVETNISKTLEPLDNMIKLLNDKDASPANFHQNQIEAIKADDTHGWLVSKDKGAISRQMIVGRAVMGEQYFPDWIRSIQGQDLDKPIKDVFTQEAMSAVAPITDKRGQPVQRYMKDAIQHGKETDMGDDNYFGKIVELPLHLADPKMPLAAKDKMIDWAFNPKNIGRLDELKQDYIDPNTGMKVPGQYRAFNVLSSPAITNAVRQTALVHPDNYAKYRSTLEVEFGNIYKQSVLDLNKLVGKDYLGVHFSWNEGTHELGLVDKSNRPIELDPRMSGRIPAIQNPDAKYIMTALDKLKDLNTGISHMDTIYKNDPRAGQESDTSKQLFRLLQTMKFDGGDVTGGPQNTIFNIQKSMIKARNPDTTEEQVNKLLKSE